jgi:hypothetical protein
MKVRKSLSKPKMTLSPKVSKKSKPLVQVKEEKAEKLRNSIGALYPKEQLEEPTLQLDKVVFQS